MTSPKTTTADRMLAATHGSDSAEWCETCGVMRGEKCWGHCVGTSWEKRWKQKVNLHDRTMQMVKTMKTL